MFGRRKLKAEIVRLSYRVSELEERLCPCESHSWVMLDSDFTIGSSAGDIDTIYRYKCRRCGKTLKTYKLLPPETDWSVSQVEALADEVLEQDNIGAGPASGSYRTEGMVIVPCSMKTAAGIVSGYTDNLLLRAADVTIKEKRPLVLAARETPMSEIHLRNLYELSRLSNVWIVPPMMTFYQKPESIDDMVTHLAAKLLSPFGVEVKEYRRWKGC